MLTGKAHIRSAFQQTVKKNRDEMGTIWAYLKTLCQAGYQSAHFHPGPLQDHPIYV